VPISTNKNPGSGARVRYATFFNVRQCQTDESLAGPWRSRNCQRIWHTPSSVKAKVRGFIQHPRWQVSRPQGAQTWITQFNLQTTPCLHLAFVRFHQMAPPRTVVTTSSCGLLLIYRPRKDERLSWSSWLTYSGRFTHISGHPSAVGRAQDSESSPVKDQRSTAEPWNHVLTSMLR